MTDEEIMYHWRGLPGRTEWLGSYKNWKKVAETPELGLIWYRIDMPDGGYITACDHPETDGRADVVYFHTKPGEPFSVHTERLAYRMHQILIEIKQAARQRLEEKRRAAIAATP